MAFTLRPDEKQDKSLDRLAELTNTNTKSKTVMYLIEHGERLIKAEKELNTLKDALKAKEHANDVISKIISQV